MMHCVGQWHAMIISVPLLVTTVGLHVVYRVLTASIANKTSTSWQSSYKTHCDVTVNVLYCEVEDIGLSDHDSKRVL